MQQKQDDALFNQTPENREQARNIGADCKTTSRSFAYWLKDKLPGFAPELQAKAERALFAVRGLEQKPANQSPAFRANAKADITAFLTAYAAA